MPAPIKNNSDKPTGNFKLLTIMVLILLATIGVLFYAATLPANETNTNQSDQTPQVAGLTTNEEYVPPEDISNLQDSNNDQETTYVVESISDGDTVKVRTSNNIETVRLIGVDTPETRDPRKSVQCYGSQASEFTKKNLLGKTVRLLADPTQQNRDKYNRLLRYIYLADGTLFNQQLIQSGYAYEYTYKVPYQYSEDFKLAEKNAASNKLGLWNEATCNGKR